MAFKVELPAHRRRMGLPTKPPRQSEVMSAIQQARHRPFPAAERIVATYRIETPLAVDRAAVGGREVGRHRGVAGDQVDGEVVVAVGLVEAGVAGRGVRSGRRYEWSQA